MADVFISYKKEDRSRIEKLVRALENAGFTVWYDYNIETGNDWFEQILREIDIARCVVGCWTESAVLNNGLFSSEYVTVEHRRDRRKLAPAVMDAGRVPAEFSNIQAADLIGWDGEDISHPGFRQLVARIESLAAPKWIERRIFTLESELATERTKRTSIEERAAVLESSLNAEARKVASAEIVAKATVDAKLALAEEEIRRLQNDLSLERAQISQFREWGGLTKPTAQRKLLLRAGSLTWQIAWRGLLILVGIALCLQYAQRGPLSIELTTETHWHIADGVDFLHNDISYVPWFYPMIAGTLWQWARSGFRIPAMMSAALFMLVLIGGVIWLRGSYADALWQSQLDATTRHIYPEDGAFGTPFGKVHDWQVGCFVGLALIVIFIPRLKIEQSRFARRASLALSVLLDRKSDSSKSVDR